MGHEYFIKITKKFGFPEVDIFASANNKKCEKYFSWTPDPQALVTDSFTVNWKNIFFYAFPPFILILRTLYKIQQERAEGIIVVPKWPNQPWYPLFLKLIISDVLEFKPSNNLLMSLCRKEHHPRVAHLSLIAAVVSGKRSA